MTKRTKRKKISASQKKVPYELTPLSPEMFKAGVLNVLATNVPDYAKQAAELLNCDPVKDRAMIDEVSYHNQVIQLEADVVEKALNEELNDAYSTLQNACFFSEQDYAYIKQVHGEEAGSKMPAYIHLRLSQVDDLALSIDFLGAIYSAEVYAQSEPTSFSSYDADEVKHKINTYEDMLTPEQKAKANYIASKMFYLQNATTKISAEGSEKECLDKVLQFTSDYKLIAYADSRLDKTAAKSVRRAYQRALKSAKDKTAKYHINLALGNIYSQDTNQVGFTYPQSEKVKAGEKSVKFFLHAYRYAPKEERLAIMKKLAEVQMNMGNLSDWKQTKINIALKFLKNEDRFNALNAVAAKLDDAELFNKSAELCKQSKMPESRKLDMLEKTYTQMARFLKSPEKKKEALGHLGEVKKQKQDVLARTLVQKNKGKDK